MCGGEGNYYLPVEDMPMEALCFYLMNTLKMMDYHLSEGQYSMWTDARDRYFLVLNQIKKNVKEVPLDFLIQMANKTDASIGYTDPSEIPSTKETISDIAKIEIHRRSLLNFTTANRKGKFVPNNFGFPRKPTY